MNKKTMYVSAIAFLLSFFAACNMTGPDPERISGYDGKVAVHVQVGGTSIQGRTVRPAPLQDVTAWQLRGGKQGDTETLLAEFSGDEEKTVVLDSGTWSFTLTGYKDDAVILTGSILEQNISLEGTNTLEFTVAPVLEGEGTLNIVVELPAGSGITTARVFKDGTELESPIEPVDNRIVVTGTYPAGVYSFSIRLYNGNELYGVVSEAVYVWANLESAKTYTLAQENLNLSYLITYHLWDEETETGSYQYTDAALTLEASTRAGYGFEGWYENADFSGEPVTVIPAGSVGDKTFYAKWGDQPQHTVTFDADGGTPATETRTVNSGDSVGSSSPITNITYSSTSGGTWTLLDDGRRQSPDMDYYSSEIKERISFTSNADAVSIIIQLGVFSDMEPGYDYAFISTLDNANATYNNGCYEDSVISGTDSVTVTIPIPTAGDHFIDIGYLKGYSGYSSSGAWFKVTDLGSSGMPSDPTRSGYSFGGWYTQQNGGGDQFTGDTSVSADITVYAKWLPSTSVQIQLRPTPTDPLLINTSVSMNEDASFSAESGYDSYQWYWDGEAIDGADSPDYTLETDSKTPGIYDLSVVGTTSVGERLSARCRVTITAY